MSLVTFRQMMPGKKMPQKLLKSILQHLLLALDFLHTETGVSHTGIVKNNSLNPQLFPVCDAVAWL